MDTSQLQAMHAYIQQLNFQTASTVASTTPNLLATNSILNNQNLINNNNIPPPPLPPPTTTTTTTTINDSNNLNSLAALALLYANQQNSANNYQIPQKSQQSNIPFQIPAPTPVTTSTMPSLTFQQQPQISASSTMYNPNIQIQTLQNQIEQQALLNQLSQIIGTLGHPQMPSQIGNNVYPQHQQPIFQQPFHQQQHQQNTSVSMMSKPPILTPSQPIQIPKHSQLPRQSLPSSTPENIRKRRHRDVEMISQPSSQSGSPNNNNNLINDKFPRSRAFTSPETMKQQQQQQQQQQQSVKGEQSLHHPSSSPDKIAKFDPSCPLRHHPDNLSPPNQQAMMLEQITTAYILNALGESAYRDPTTTTTTATKDENKTQKCDNNGMENNTKDNNIEKSGNIVKIPMSEIHRMIEDCYNDL